MELGGNVLQLANEFLIYVQLGVAWCLVLKVKKALCTGPDENLPNGFVKNFFPDNQWSHTGHAMFCCLQ